MALPAPQASVSPPAHKKLRLFRAVAAAQHSTQLVPFRLPFMQILEVGRGVQGSHSYPEITTSPGSLPLSGLFPCASSPVALPRGLDSRSGQRPCDKSPWALPRHTGLCLFALSRTAPLATAARQPSRAAEAEFLRREGGEKCVTGPGTSSAAGLLFTSGAAFPWEVRELG